MTGVYKDKIEGVYRILDLGDSLSWGISYAGGVLWTGETAYFQLLPDMMDHQYRFVNVAATGTDISDWTQPKIIPALDVVILGGAYEVQATPVLEPATGERIDLALVHLGANNVVNFWAATHTTEQYIAGLLALVNQLLTDRVKKIVLFTVTPNFSILANPVQLARLHAYNKAILATTWPASVEVLHVFPHLDETDFTDQNVHPNAKGHRKLARIVRRHIRQTVHKKPMRTVGTAPFYPRMLGDVMYPPNWYIDE